MKNLFACGSRKAGDAVVDPTDATPASATADAGTGKKKAASKKASKKTKTDETPIIGETAAQTTDDTTTAAASEEGKDAEPAAAAEVKKGEAAPNEAPKAEEVASKEEDKKTEDEQKEESSDATPAAAAAASEDASTAAASKKQGFFSKLFGAAVGVATGSQKALPEAFAEQQIIFVLGQPGSGKGTQCTSMAKEFALVHISAGDLLRAEVANHSEHGKMIDDFIREGKIVPVEITLALLRKAMEKESKAKGFLIDGFPRQIDQAEAFETSIRQPNLILFFNCPEDVLLPRLLKRGETSGRIDDNEESIKKRFKTFNEISVKCVERYSAQNKILEIDASKDVAAVWADLEKALQERGIQKQPAAAE